MHQQPWATPILLIALGVAFAAIFGRVQPMVFGDTTAKRLPHPPALLPVFAHRRSCWVLGLYIRRIWRTGIARGAPHRRALKCRCTAGGNALASYGRTADARAGV